MVTDDAGHGIVKNLMRSALPVPVRLIVPVDPKIRSGCSGDPVVPVVPVAAMPSGKKGMYNLDLSEANAETSLLARLCSARFVICVHM